MLQSNEREIFSHYFTISWRSRAQATINMNLPPMREIAKILDRAHKETTQRGETIARFIKNDQAAVRLYDVRVTNDSCIFLFGYADRNTANPAFMNIENGAARVVEKARDEGLGYSSHCLVRQDPIENDQTTYEVLLEKVPGATRSVLLPFLNQLLKDYTHYEWKFRDEHPVGIWPHLDIFHKPNSNLHNALSNGYIDSIDLVKTKIIPQGLDENSEIKEAKEKITFKLEKNEDENIISKTINGIKRWANTEGYDNIKLRYKSDRRSETIEISKMGDDIRDYSFTQRHTITLDRPMNQLVTNFNDELINKMNNLI